MDAGGDALQGDAGEVVQALGLQGAEVGHGVGLGTAEQAKHGLIGGVLTRVAEPVGDLAVRQALGA